MNTSSHSVAKLQASLMEKIVKFSYTFVAVVVEVEIPFVYSIGASRFDVNGKSMPELVMSSGNMTARQMQDILHSLIVLWKDKQCVTLGKLDVLEGDRGTYTGLKVVAVDQNLVKNTHTCQVSLIHPEERYDVVQVMYPDRAGVYPDEIGYDHDGYPQEALAALK